MADEIKFIVDETHSYLDEANNILSQLEKETLHLDKNVILLRSLIKAAYKLHIPKKSHIVIPEKKDITTKKNYPLIVLQKNNRILASVEIHNNKYYLIEPNIPGSTHKLIHYFTNNKTEPNQDNIRKTCKKFKIQYSEDLADVTRYYVDRNKGLGKIEPLIRDKNINTIEIKNVLEPVEINFNFDKLTTNIIYDSIEELNDLILHIARILHNHVNEDEPFLEGILPSGYSVQATFGSKYMHPKIILTR